MPIVVDMYICNHRDLRVIKMVNFPETIKIETQLDSQMFEIYVLLSSSYLGIVNVSLKSSEI